MKIIKREKYTELVKKCNLIFRNDTKNDTKKLIEDDFPESKVRKIMRLPLFSGIGFGLYRKKANSKFL